MKILHINTELTWRGGERQIALLVKYTPVQHVVACLPKGELHTRLSPDHKVIDLNPSHGLDVRAALKLKKVCDAHAIDLIHCHTPKAHTLAVMSRLLGCNRPILCTKRTSFKIGNNFFSKYKYRKVDQVVCLTEGAKQQLLKQLPDLKVDVIPSAIEQTQQVNRGMISNHLPETQNLIKVGYVAALTAEKNPEVFIDTARKVLTKHADVHFLWIGDGRLLTAIKQQVSEDPVLRDRISFPGFQKMIQPWIADLDLLFFPSLAEGMGTTLLDAMQHQVPIVASNIPGINNILKNEESGLLGDPQDAHGFAESIDKLLIDKVLRDRLCARAFEDVQDYFVEPMVERYLTWYRKLLKLPG